VEHLA